MNLDQLLQHRNNELAKQDALILDLLMQIKKLEIALEDKDIEIYKLNAQIFNLNLEK